MFFQRVSVWLVAAMILSAVSMASRDTDSRPEFGTIESAYRNAHSDTAWFIHQDRDDASSFGAEAKGAEDSDTAILDPNRGDQPTTMALAHSKGSGTTGW